MKKHPILGGISVGSFRAGVGMARVVSSRINRLLLSNNPSDRRDAERLLDAARRGLLRCAVCRATFGEGEKPQAIVAVMVKKRVFHGTVCGKCAARPEEEWRRKAGETVLEDLARAKEGPPIVDAWRPASGLGDVVAQSVDKTFLVSAVEPGFGRFIVALHVGDGDLKFARITAASDAEAEARRSEVMAALANSGAQEVRQHPETGEAFEDAARAVFWSARP